jgi:hypothetical protein
MATLKVRAVSAAKKMFFIELSIIFSSGEMSGVDDVEVDLCYLHIQYRAVGF